MEKIKSVIIEKIWKRKTKKHNKIALEIMNKKKIIKIINEKLRKKRLQGLLIKNY